MKAHYFEILEAFDTEPLWYDCYGVPRWCTPEEARYPRHLMGRIKCQECQKEFWVALGNPVYFQSLATMLGEPGGNVVRVEGAELNPVDHSDLKLADNWRYGDPPRHNGDCAAGDTMSSVTEDEWEGFWDKSNG